MSWFIFFHFLKPGLSLQAQVRNRWEKVLQASSFYQVMVKRARF